MGIKSLSLPLVRAIDSTLKDIAPDTQRWLFGTLEPFSIDHAISENLLTIRTPLRLAGTIDEARVRELLSHYTRARHPLLARIAMYRELPCAVHPLSEVDRACTLLAERHGKATYLGVGQIGREIEHVLCTYVRGSGADVEEWTYRPTSAANRRQSERLSPARRRQH